ncbi:zinc finger protein 2 [Lutzomyia longipalpis]|uniref:zinc finger protein 2 n=1 Tax=Lutzomyia longipalpis TaxID=7200 RepID=UPI002484318F|nr:zinc finger protein 2 [Lutzomyia longipalpis]
MQVSGKLRNSADLIKNKMSVTEKKQEDTVEIRELLKESLCRLCLNVSDDLIGIFSADGRTQLSIRIMACTSLEVTPDDPLPNRICSTCNDFLKIFYAFRKKCKSSDTKFRRFLRLEAAGKANSIAELSDDEDDEEYASALKEFNEKQNSLIEERLKEATEEIVKQYEVEKCNILQEEKLRIYREEKQKIQENAMRQIVTTLRQKERDERKDLPAGKEKVFRISNKICETKEDTQDDSVEFQVIFEEVKSENAESLHSDDYTVDIASEVGSGHEDEISEEHLEALAVEEVFENKNTEKSLETIAEVEYFEEKEEEEEEDKQESMEIVPVPDIVDTAESNDQESLQHESTPPGSPNSAQNIEIETDEGRIYYLEVEEQENAPKYYDEKGNLLIYKCSMCPKTFPREKSLKSHEKSHMKRKGYSCTFCEKWFPSNSSRTRHERIHTGEKPFSCGICGRSFVQKEILKRHVVVHSGDKPFKCSKCDKQFTQKEILRQHMNRKHTKNPVVERHACFLCPKQFCHASGLSRHLLVHAGRTFACGVCGKEFVDKSALKRHTNNIHKSTE